MQTDNFIPIPQALKVPVQSSENITLISGNGTTFLLSSKPLDTEFDKIFTISD